MSIFFVKEGMIRRAYSYSSLCKSWRYNERMSLEKSVEAVIKEAMERGEFDNLKGRGQPLDLSAYFETPEDLRMAYSLLKNAGMVSAEVELLQEIAALKERLATTCEESQRRRIKRIVSEKQLQFNVMMERRKRRNKERR